MLTSLNSACRKIIGSRTYFSDMAITEIEAKTLLRKQKRIDSWFLSSCCMNLYRGCTHDCGYCDGRAETYYVDGVFGKDVLIKINAADVLRRELNPHRKRSPFPGGFVLLGGGVGDSYQPVEDRYCIARKCLLQLLERSVPVHVLTKSTLVERDLDILSEMSKAAGAVVSMSFSTIDDKLAQVLEPGVPLPSQRLATLEKIRTLGLNTGMYLMPIIPSITDSPLQINAAFSAAKGIGVDFVVGSPMTLKPGRQREHFLSLQGQSFPEKTAEYQIIYGGDPWGFPRSDYHDSLNHLLRAAAVHHKVPLRMPRRCFAGIVNRKELSIVLMEHIDYLQRLRGSTSAYGYAARSIAQTDFTPQELRWGLDQLKGVGPVVRKSVIEILDTGTAQEYERLMGEFD